MPKMLLRRLLARWGVPVAPAPRPRPAPRPLVEELEPRVLYSAELNPLLAAAVAAEPAPAAELRLVDDHAASGAPATASATTASRPADERRHEIAFIDARLTDADDLIDRLRQARPAGTALELVLIEPDRDGLEQIHQVLAGSRGLDAVHILSHGSSGQLQLGSTRLDSAALDARAGEFTVWQRALGDQADLLLWGCDVAAGAAGADFLDRLARLTTADVAASRDATGAAAYGGDWQLEQHSGPVETALDTSALAGWQGLMATYTVTNLNDSGAGSLRQAILNANANGGADTISFSVFGTINLAAALPQITGQVSINGTNGGLPGIVLNGSGLVAVGLDLQAGSDGSTLRGLVLQNFSSRGIYVVDAANVTIAGNYIGTSADGNTTAGNSVGIDLTNAANAMVGGTTAADRNIISGNSNIGINVWGPASSGTVIQGNRIGTNTAGSADLGNTHHGIFLSNTSGITIGGTASGAGNLISGNDGAGITVGTTATGITIQGNTIGLNLAGTGALANLASGIWIQGANNTVGGTSTAARNLISGNAEHGIRISGASATGNTVLGNYIGTGSNGTTGQANGQDGIQLDTGASHNTIGGTASGARNIIAGNNHSGVSIQDLASTGNTLLGNWIGVGANGTTQLGNSHAGVWIEGTNSIVGDGTAAGRNVITANWTHGVTTVAAAAGTRIRGNWIIDNSADGIDIAGSSTGSVVGGDSHDEANLIAYNGTDGVNVTSPSATAVTILGNHIHGNGQRGIDLGNNGYDTNDSGDGDTGPNGYQNYPVLSSASASTTGTTFVGTLNSTAGTNFRIDFYANRPSHVDGIHGEGERWLGFTVVPTDGSGNATINHALTGVWINHGDRVTATATRMDGAGYLATSEFAANITATATGVVVVDTASDTADGTTTNITTLGTARGGDGRVSLREAMAAVNNTANGAAADRIVFAIPPNIESGNLNTALAPPTIAVASNLTPQTQAVNIDATTQPGYASTPLVRLDASGAVTHGLQLNAGSAGSTIRGLSITGFTAAGIGVTSSNSNTIAGNYLGLAPDGLTVDANYRGIVVTSSTGTLIGGVNAADRNVVSGNSWGNLYFNAAVNSVVYGNYIGTDATGLVDADGLNSAMGKSGVYLDGASTGNQIGNTIPGARNIISGNDWVGVDIISSSATNNTIAGNYIGTTLTGLAALPNQYGVSFYTSGTGNRAVGNVISGNAIYGVQANSGSSGAIIQGNYIGVGADGSTLVGSQLSGVRVFASATNTLIGTNADGSNDAAEANVISGNVNGIIIADAGTTGTLVQGNLIGTDASGLLARGNTFDGIRIENGATGNTVGGSTTSRRNIIAANGQEGVQIDGEASDGNSVRGNWIGVNVTGTATLGNGGDGIFVSGGADNATIGGTGANDGNWIAASGLVGIEVDGASTGTVIQGNRIGTDLAGTGNWGGQQDGILLEGGASGSTVGVHSGSGGNIVAYSGQGGVHTSAIKVQGSGTGNAIFGNTVYGQAGLPIDLGGNGVTANDAAPDSDSGANNLQNFPVLATARTNGSNQLILTGTLTSATNSFYRVHFYGSSAQHGSGHGPAEVYLGHADVATNGAGLGTVNVTLPANVAVGSFITATATQATDGSYSSFTDTSEFARNIAVVDSTQATVTVDTTSDTSDGDTTSLSTLIANKGADGVISLREAITAANNTANGTGGADRIVFGIGDALAGGAHTITITGTDLPTITQAVSIDGRSEPDAAAGPVVVLDGANLRSIGLNVQASDVTIRGLVLQRFASSGIAVGGGASNLVIAGNHIGTDVTGLVARGNGGWGIDIVAAGSGIVIGGTTLADRNVIGGNVGWGGIAINGATGTTVIGNHIGVGADGSTPLGNGYGIFLLNGAPGTRIGGTTAAEANVIANNASEGIEVTGGGQSVAILRNSIFGNGGLGIDLNYNGVPETNDAGDADGGANAGQNHPVLTLALTDGNQTWITGSLNSEANSHYRIEFFASSSIDASGHGEGQRYLGSVNLATGPGGAAGGSFNLASNLAVGEYVTATATKTDASYANPSVTSEFSRAVAAISSTQATVTVDTTSDTSDGDTTSLSTLIANKGADGFISLREAITAANNTANGSSPDLIRFGIAGTGVHTLMPVAALPTITQAVVLDASTDDSFAANGNRPAIVIDGLGLTGAGLTLSATADGSTVRGFSIVDYNGEALLVEAGSDNHLIVGNYIGLLPDGTTTLSNLFGLTVQGDGNQIGGTTAADRNVLSGNVNMGLWLSGSQNTVTGNFIGTDASGTLDRGNSHDGIAVSGGNNNRIGGTLAAERNLISGNNRQGIEIFGVATGTQVQGNYIGTDLSGAQALGNGQGGIWLGMATMGHTIGGTAPGAGNLIAYNQAPTGQAGVMLAPDVTGISILGNRFMANAGLAIDLDMNGVSANDAAPDADTGANNLQNFPVLTSALSDGAGRLLVSGSLVSSASTAFRIEFFASASPDGSNHGEGERYLGFVNVTTDATGRANIAGTLSASVSPGETVTATATRSNATFTSHSDTSEFSQGVQATATPAQALTWHTFLGSTGSDEARAIATDSQANVVTAGSSAATWGTPVNPYGGGSSASIAKLDRSGNLLWNTFLGGGTTYAYGVTVDANDDIYVTGYTNSVWGPTVRGYSGGNDAFVTKLDGQTGAVVWNTYLGGGGHDWGNRLSVDAAGHVHVVGVSNATWGTPVRGFTASGANTDGFAAKLDSSGALVWNSFLGGTSNDEALALAVDGSGNLHVGGLSWGSWGAPIRAWSTSGDMTAAKLDANGNLVWSTFLGGSQYEEVTDLALDATGNLYLSGFGTGTWGSPLTGFSGATDGVLAKVGANGALAWHTFMGSAGNDRGNAVDVAADGSIVVAGASSATWGAPWRAYSGGEDIFLARYDSSGSRHALGFFGSGGALDQGMAVTVDNAGDLLLAGHSEATWGSPIRAYSSGRDMAVVKVSMTGLPNTAPVLDATKSPTLANQAEDAGLPSGAVGTLVSALVDLASPAGQVDNVSDPDGGALLGIAVTAADISHGSWWYSIDNGATWNALGTVSDASARLLAADASTRVYFQPAADYHGSIAAALTIRAWDQTSGSHGGLADTSTHGGSTAFSTATDTVSLGVTAVNDAPRFGEGTGLRLDSLPGSPNSAQARAVVFQPDGRFIVAGQAN